MFLAFKNQNGERLLECAHHCKLVENFTLGHFGSELNHFEIAALTTDSGNRNGLSVTLMRMQSFVKVKVPLTPRPEKVPLSPAILN